MKLHVGDRIHGYAGGIFGRDSYDCRVVEAEGRDWIVTRNDRGEAEFVDRERAERWAEPDDRSFCDEECGT